eukprot:5644605-Pyramimonas_sp.AAC.1
MMQYASAWATNTGNAPVANEGVQPAQSTAWDVSCGCATFIMQQMGCNASGATSGLERRLCNF